MSDLRPPIVDSHCHLNDERLFGEVGDVIQRAHDAGVTVLQTICTRRSDFPVIHKLTQSYPNLYCSFGIHPHHVDEDVVDEAEIIAHGQLDKVIGIGETGLDYYYDNAPRAQQQESFRRHIRAARALDLPVIIHTRDAEEDTIAILNELREEGPFRTLFHCFSSSPKLAEYATEQGIYVSASGILTFKKSDELRAAFARIPTERLLVETDAPYLAPVPQRGKVCEPAYTVHTAACLAELKGLSYAELATATTANFFRLFSKAQPPA